MHGESKTYPERIVDHKGKKQVRFNIQEVKRPDPNMEEESFFAYEYVTVGELDRKSLIDAMIRAKYDVNDEFNVREKPEDDPEYIEFVNYRDNCKAQVDEILNVE